MRDLWPPLSIIQQRIAPMAVGTADVALSSEPQLGDMPMPSAVSEVISRILQAQTLDQQPGQGGAIVLVTEAFDEFGRAVGPLPSPVAFCLDRRKVSQGPVTEWVGWMVSPDVDYAADMDVLLEPCDGPFDPVAGMIQAWNRVTLRIPHDPRILGRLNDYRLSIVREVESDGPIVDSASPGRIALRSTRSGRSVLTGSPLGTTDDPRIPYRKLYADLTHRLDVAYVQQGVVNNKAESTRHAGFQSRFLTWVLGHRVQMAGFAATIAGVVVATHLVLHEGDQPEPAQVARAEMPPTVAPTPKAEQLPSQDSSNAASMTARSKTGSATSRVKKEPQPIRRTEVALQDSGSPAIEQFSSVESPFFRPVKEDSIVLAMRSGKGTPNDAAFEVRIKDKAKINDAVDYLMSLGFRILRVNEDAAIAMLSAPPDRITAELDAKLEATGLFLASGSRSSGK